tara:strand:- start:2696 stop:2938 length:243 start_codon:yes stop_codon:yes gene_type:complete
MAPKKKPPALSMEQEAKNFMKTTKGTTEKKKVSEVDLESTKAQLAASILAGLIASGGRTRAEELVTEAFRYADLILKHKK